MVKKRNEKAFKKQLKKFASAAASTPSKTAPRVYKSIRVGLNEYEYERLAKGAAMHNRSKLNYIRWAIITLSKEDE